MKGKQKCTDKFAQHTTSIPAATALDRYHGNDTTHAKRSVSYFACGQKRAATETPPPR